MEVAARVLQAVGRPLVHDHHVRQAEAEEPVVLPHHRLEHAGEVQPDRAVELVDRLHVMLGVEVHLVGVAGVEGDERDEVRVLGDDPAAVLELGGEHVAVQAVARPGVVLGLARKLALDLGRQVAEGVDLAVGVVERHPDGLALVLEDEDVGDLVTRPEGPVAVLPHPDEPLDLGDRAVREGALVLGGVEHHLAGSRCRAHRHQVAALDRGRVRVGPEGGELVLEDHVLVVGSRHLGGEAPGLGRADRAVVRGRHEGAVLPVGGGDHPLLGDGVPAQLGHQSASGTKR
ncbi:hypothetical protein D3C86_1265620 [compost metagenome]